MSTDTDGTEEMVTLKPKVPERLLEDTNELAAELEYPNRSAFIRDVLRDTTQPILTPGVQEGLSEGCADVEAGRTMSTDEVRSRLCIGKTED